MTLIAIQTMPVKINCEGVPTGPCPFKAKGNLSQGDYMLCKHCEAIRFPVSKNNNNKDDVSSNLFQDFIDTAKYEHLKLIESMSISQLKRLDRDAVYDELYIRLVHTFPNSTPDVSKMRLCLNAAYGIEDAAKLQLAKKESLRGSKNTHVVNKAKNVLQSASKAAGRIFDSINRTLHGPVKSAPTRDANLPTNVCDGSYISQDSADESLRLSPHNSPVCIPETQLSFADKNDSLQSMQKTPPTAAEPTILNMPSEGTAGADAAAHGDVSSIPSISPVALSNHNGSFPLVDPAGAGAGRPNKKEKKGRKGRKRKSIIKPDFSDSTNPPCVNKPPKSTNVDPPQTMTAHKPPKKRGRPPKKSESKPNVKKPFPTGTSENPSVCHNRCQHQNSSILALIQCSLCKEFFHKVCVSFDERYDSTHFKCTSCHKTTIQLTDIHEKMCKMSSAITDLQKNMKTLIAANNELTNQNRILVKHIDGLQSRKRLTSTPNVEPSTPPVFDEYIPITQPAPIHYRHPDIHHPHRNSHTDHHYAHQQSNFEPANTRRRANKTRPHQHRHYRQNPHHYTPNAPVLILGDGIPNQLDANRLSKSVESHVAMETQQTLDSAIHRLSKEINSDVQTLAIFTGSNNLNLEPVSVTTGKTLKLEDNILNLKHRPPKIIIHGILPRTDVQIPPSKRLIVNNALEEMCNRNNWRYIDPDYFSTRLLDRGGLYPAGRGKGAIASSLISAIGRGGFPRTPMTAIREDNFE